MEFFSDQPDTPKAVCAVRTIYASNQIIAVHAANAVLKLSALVALSATTDMSAISASERRHRIVTTVAIATIGTEHTLTAILATVGVKTLRVTSIFAFLKEATIFSLESAHVHGPAY